MSRIGDKSHWVLFACFLASVVLTAIVGVLGLVEGLNALFDPAAGGFFLVRVFQAVVQYVIALIILAALDVAFLVGTVVATLRKASLPKSDRLARFAGWAEREYPVLGSLDISDRFDLDPEHRREKLKERYVEGEIDELEFERRMQDLMDDTDETRGSKEDASTHSSYEYDR